MAFGGNLPVVALSLPTPRPPCGTSRGRVSLRARPHVEPHTAVNAVHLDASLQPFVLRGSACVSRSAELEVRNSNYRSENDRVHSSSEASRCPVSNTGFHGVRLPIRNTSRSIQRPSFQSGAVNRHLAVSGTVRFSVRSPERFEYESLEVVPRHDQEYRRLQDVKYEEQSSRSRSTRSGRSPMPSLRHRAGTRAGGNEQIQNSALLVPQGAACGQQVHVVNRNENTLAVKTASFTVRSEVATSHRTSAVNTEAVTSLRTAAVISVKPEPEGTASVRPEAVRTPAVSTQVVGTCAGNTESFRTAAIRPDLRKRGVSAEAVDACTVNSETIRTAEIIPEAVGTPAVNTVSAPTPERLHRSSSGVGAEAFRPEASTTPVVNTDAVWTPADSIDPEKTKASECSSPFRRKVDCGDGEQLVSTGNSIKFSANRKRLKLRAAMPRRSIRNIDKGTLSRSASRNEERPVFSRTSSRYSDSPFSRCSSRTGDRGVVSRCASRNGDRSALSRCSSRYGERQMPSRCSSRTQDLGEQRAKSALDRRVVPDLQTVGGRVPSKSAGAGGRTRPDDAATLTRSSPKAKEKSPSKDLEPLGDRQVTWFMSLWQQCVRNNTLDKMCSILKRMPRPHRKQLANYKHEDENTMLFVCCQMGNVDMVRYLLEECDADIEQLGVYKVSGDGVSHKVSPLWCAAVADHVQVVECLLQHGADINHTSDTGSTPVRSACFMTNMEVVKKLVEAGADIHRPNVNGGTCLINSVQSVELCTYLIKHGARVNDRDNSGNLALHYAIREDRLDTVQLLIQHGSDYNAKNDSSDTALQTAALRGFENIVDYLIEHTASKLIDAIHAYELLGAHCVDERHDIVAGIAFWKRAMALRYMDPKAPLLKNVTRERKEAYSGRLEACTMEELEEIGSDPDKIYIESLLVRERILGPVHKDTTFGIMYRGAIYADNHNFQRCIDLWKYAYRLRYSQYDDPLGSELVFTALALVRLMWEVRDDFADFVGEDAVRFDDALDVLKMLVGHIERAEKNVDAIIKEGIHRDSQFGLQVPIQMSENFTYLMHLSLHMCHLMVAKLQSDSRQQHRLRCLVYGLLKMNPRMRGNETLLHMALSSNMQDVIRGAGIPPPSVIELLLECGADVEAVTVKGETPLSYCLKPKFDAARPREWEKEDYVNVLLKHGAHVDRTNKNGKTCLAALQKVHNFCLLDHVTLQCLAARVIKQNYTALESRVEELSSPLIAFVNMH